MKNLISFILLPTFICCNPVKNPPGDSSGVTIPGVATKESIEKNETKSATPTKTVILNNPSEARDETTVSSDGKNVNTKMNNDNSVNALQDRALPSCINKLVTRFKKEEIQNPPRKIYSYTYKGKTVYYVTPPCCDFFSDLYDVKCNLIAHPDGGITGKGDGRASDFIQLRTNEKLIWEDNRKYR